jgi:hypothetical protein
MFDKLKLKWGVNNLNLFLIILTFAAGGSLCGRLARYILNYFQFEENYGALFYWITYIVAMTILWPLCVISVSVITGQFTFFKNYLKKIFSRFSGK